MIFPYRTAIKYINKTMDDIKKRPVDSQEDPSILEELFIQNISPKDAMVMVCDMLIAGIDTVVIYTYTAFCLFLIMTIILLNRLQTRQVSCFTS